MKTKTITVSEYALAYGCSNSYVNRMLKKDTGLTGMVSWKKSGGTWLIEVLDSWYQSKIGK